MLTTDGLMPSLALAGLVITAVSLTGVAQERDRTKIEDKYKWNLADLYPSEAAWRAAKEQLAAEIPTLDRFRGKLTASATTLADALDRLYALDKELSRLAVYAGSLADQDTRDQSHQGMQQEIVQLAATFGAAASYIEPEILQADKAKIESFISSEARLKIYAFYLRDVLRRAAHTLSQAEEKLLADAGPVMGTADNAYNILSNADFPYPSVTLSDGKTVKLDQANFTALRALPLRADREKVMSAFFTALGSFSRTYGTTLNGEVQKVQFLTKARKYGSPLEFALNAANIPTANFGWTTTGRTYSPVKFAAAVEVTESSSRSTTCASTLPALSLLMTRTKLLMIGPHCRSPCAW